jgi:hypothetical protein
VPTAQVMDLVVRAQRSSQVSSGGCLGENQAGGRRDDVDEDSNGSKWHTRTWMIWMNGDWRDKFIAAPGPTSKLHIHECLNKSGFVAMRGSKVFRVDVRVIL